MKELLNTLKPLRLSFSDEIYSEYTMLVSSITSQFKFNCIDFDKRDELLEYVIPSLRYINKHIILEKSNDVLDKIDKFVDIVSHINDAIIEKNCNVICKDILYDREKFDLVYFTYLWTSLTTNMLVRLKYNYGWKEKKPTVSVQGCCCCGCCECCEYCNCCCNSTCNNNTRIPIQESYYTKWDTDESYLESF